MSPFPGTGTFGTPSGPARPEPEDDDNSLISKFIDLLKELYDKNFDATQLTCDNGKSRGWKFFGNEVEFAECGCHQDALWPDLLSMPLGIVSNIGQALLEKPARRLARRARRRFTRPIIKKIKDQIAELNESYYLGIKLLSNVHYLKRKLPPVPPGHIRLYRGCGMRRLQARERGIDLRIDGPPSPVDATSDFFDDTTTGRYWTNNIRYAESYTKFVPGSHGTPGYFTKESEIFFIDIPIEEAAKARLNASNPVLGLLPGQRRCGGIGYFDQAAQEYRFPPDTIMPLRRRKTLPDGTTVIVREDGYPLASTDLELNPAIFSWGDKDGAQEFFLDSPVNGTNFIASLSEENNLIKTHKQHILKEVRDVTKDFKDSLADLEKTIASPLSSSDTINSKLADAVAKRSAMVAKIEEKFDVGAPKGWGKAFDDTPPIDEQLVPWPKIPDDSILDIQSTITWMFGWLVWIIAISQIVTVVEDKKCGPKNYRYSMMNGSDFSNWWNGRDVYFTDDEWDLIRAKLIADNSYEVWAEFDDNCECNSCPDSYELCTAAGNFAFEYYNVCKQCVIRCGSNANEEIYATYSKVPILLSSKSIPKYNKYTQVGTDVTDGVGACECYCESSTTKRTDKDGNTISSSRKLIEYVVSDTHSDRVCLRGEPYIYERAELPPEIQAYKEQHEKYRRISGIPYKTLKRPVICDLEMPPDDTFSFLSKYEYSNGRWTCKNYEKLRNQCGDKIGWMLTEGVSKETGNYCDCTCRDGYVYDGKDCVPLPYEQTTPRSTIIP